MSVEIYQGKYVVAEDALNYIDLYTINENCKTFKVVSNRIDELLPKVSLLKDLLRKENLSFNDKNMENNLDQYEKSLRDLSLYLNDLSNTIISTTIRVLNRKQTILNDEAIHQDNEIIKLKEAQIESSAASNNEVSGISDKTLHNTIVNYSNSDNNTYTNENVNSPVKELYDEYELVQDGDLNE